MSTITSHIEIARPAEEVFAYVTDPARFSEWQDDVVSVRVEAGRAPGVARGSPRFDEWAVSSAR
jgi:uncharacterized protein YndB with AHSA1/START domain